MWMNSHKMRSRSGGGGGRAILGEEVHLLDGDGVPAIKVAGILPERVGGVEECQFLEPVHVERRNER